MTPSDRIVYIVTVIQIETVFGAETVSQATELYGKRTFVSDQRVRRFVAGRLRPQLKITAVQITHLQVLER